jgi:CHAT domain
MRQIMTKKREYIDFKLELRDLDEKADMFKVAVLPSPSVGETRQAIEVPYRFKDVEDYLYAIDRKVIDQDDLVKFGKLLGARLLPSDEIRQLFLQAYKQAGRDGGVRLRLIIREPKLAQIPWEFCYFQLHPGEISRNNFLVLNPQISMIRHEALSETYPSLEGASPASLRLVVAMANVKKYPPLNLKQERKVIEKALSNRTVDGVAIEWDPVLEDVTSEDLDFALQKGADIFHFAGHGEFNDQDVDRKSGETVGEGSLVIVKDRETREAAHLSAGNLALKLQQAGVRVAVLGACKTGRRDGISAWTGVAPALIERGIGAVVAMQYDVIDEAAIAFSKAFYASLAGGLSIDESVVTGRLAMLGVGEDDGIDWGVPVLYMRAADGNLFPQLAARKSETADQIRQIIEMTIDRVENGGVVIGVLLKEVGGSFHIVQRVKTVSGGMLIGYQVDDPDSRRSRLKTKTDRDREDVTGNANSSEEDE